MERIVRPLESLPLEHEHILNVVELEYLQHVCTSKNRKCSYTSSQLNEIFETHVERFDVTAVQILARLNFFDLLRVERSQIENTLFTSKIRKCSCISSQLNDIFQTDSKILTWQLFRFRNVSQKCDKRSYVLMRALRIPSSSCFGYLPERGKCTSSSIDNDIMVPS